MPRVDIAGVVKGGAPIERILTGYNGLDDPIGLTDGTLVFSEPVARRLHRFADGMTIDHDGRLYHRLFVLKP